MSSTRSIYQTDHLGWRVAEYVVQKPLWWGLQQLSLVDDGGGRGPPTWKQVSGEYVVVEILEVSHLRLAMH